MDPKFVLLEKPDPDRSQEIKALEKDVAELADMYKILNQTIEDQNQPLNLINDRIESTQLNVIEANQELVVAQRYQNNRRYYLLLGGGLLVTAIGGPTLLGLKATCILIPGVIAVAKGYDYLSKTDKS